MNLKELSEHLGLSKTTVSRALNGFSEVSESTRARVVAAARQMGYVPNATAHRLATGRTDTFGIVFPQVADAFSNPLFSEFAAGVADGAAAQGRGLNVLSASGGEEMCYRRLAHNKVVDAVILTDMQVDDVRVRLLSHLGLHSVSFGRTASTIPYAYCDYDNEGAFTRATELLIGLGHQRIALLCGDVRFTNAEHRHVGWLSALKKAGLPPPVGLFHTGPMSVGFGYAATHRLLSSELPPTAILCADMYLADGCVRAITDCGLKVGQDVSVIAHDDGLSAIRPESFRPALTTTYYSLRKAGMRVAEMAADVADNHKDVRTFSEVLPVDLIFRDSALPRGEKSGGWLR